MEETIPHTPQVVREEESDEIQITQVNNNDLGVLNIVKLHNSWSANEIIDIEGIHQPEVVVLVMEPDPPSPVQIAEQLQIEAR